MFSASTYIGRRRRLAADLRSGLALFLGHSEAPMNFRDNLYPFRQDGSFLYFFGLDRADVAGVIDVDEQRETIYGDELTIDDVIWTGPQRTIAEQAALVGVTETGPVAALAETLTKAIRAGRRIHFLPPYRAEIGLSLEFLLGIRPERAQAFTSIDLIKAVIAQRSIKSQEEIDDLTRALEITHDMHVLAMRTARPGVYEREVAGAMEGLALARGGRLSFSVIFSVHGEILHNHSHHHRMESGQLAVNDSGAETPSHYAGDITRTIPIGGTFQGVQRDLYQAVLRAQQRAIEAIRPGVRYKDIHLSAARSLVQDLTALGCMRGDPDAAVAAGAHALFFPHGLGHMLGLDVHDMESLGEDHVGYDETVHRSAQFGLKSLRLARALQPGFVVTVEPGLYFIPGLIDQWKAERRLTEFISYEKVESFRGAGGIRIEDNVVVTESGGRVLGPAIPKAVDDVEALAR